MWLKTVIYVFGLKIFTNVKNKYEKGIFDYFFEKKKSLNLQKNENHVAIFPYWFWFGNNVLGV
jgi:hypothetical protein